MTDSNFKKNAVGQMTTTASITDFSADTISKPTPLKWRHVLAAFVTEASFSRFEAERCLHDNCLHSTVSTIQNMCITIMPRMVTVRGYHGIPTRVCRYRIAPEFRSLTLNLLRDSSALPASENASGGLHHGQV